LFLIDGNCQESRVEVLEQVTRSHRIGPVGVVILLHWPIMRALFVVPPTAPFLPDLFLMKGGASFLSFSESGLFSISQNTDDA
jgi:hypothetical protein